MKKALAILLTAVMLLGVLTACGSKKDGAAAVSYTHLTLPTTERV